MYSIQYIYICIDVVLLVSEIQIKKKGLHSVNAVQITVSFHIETRIAKSPSADASLFLLVFTSSQKISSSLTNAATVPPSLLTDRPDSG